MDSSTPASITYEDVLNEVKKTVGKSSPSLSLSQQQQQPPQSSQQPQLNTIPVSSNPQEDEPLISSIDENLVVDASFGMKKKRSFKAPWAPGAPSIYGRGAAPKLHALKGIGLKHREIMLRLVLGHTQGEIAQKVGLTTHRLSVIVRSPLFQQELKKLELEVRGKFITTYVDAEKKAVELQGRALEIVENIMEAKEGDFKKASLTLRRACAKDILEVAGVGARNKSPEEGALSDFASLIATAFEEAQKRREASLKAQEKEAAESVSNRDAIDVTADTHEVT